MKTIHYIAAGAGNLYCGACFRDIHLIKGLQSKGFDVKVYPIYTPLKFDDDLSPLNKKIFMGGINAFIKLKGPSFIKKLPLKKFFDLPKVINFFSSFAVKTDPADLGQMAYEFLRGLEGIYQNEINILLDTLSESKPDVVFLTNTMLCSLAKPIKDQFNAKVICHLQGEEFFIEHLTDPYKTKVLDKIESFAPYVDHYTAPYDNYKNKMSELFQLEPSKISISGPSIGLPDTLNEKSSNDDIVFGLLGRIAPEKGLLGFLKLWLQIKGACHLKWSIKIAGGIMDKDYFEQIKLFLNENHLSQQVEFLGVLNANQKKNFFYDIDVFVSPSTMEESRGINVLEAMSYRRPVWISNKGIYTEFLKEQNCGWSFSEDSVEEMKGYLAGEILQNVTRKLKGENGRKLIEGKYCFEQVFPSIKSLIEN